ncbi:MAG TPA: Ig-like domain-containing protein [Solirubrobacterales bacterium]|nr:Ig-like domain-containing protein [Solirubrobacterales bacterium]
MGLRSPATRIAGIALAMSFLLVAALVAGAGAKPVAGTERISTVCAKKAGHAATAAKRKALRHRCVREMNRAAATRKRSTDTTPPSVAWLTPSAGATVKGKIGGSACEASAADERGVKRVVMAVDGAVLNTESDAPWNCSFDSTKIADGAHTLTATAYDAAGNSRTAAVTVNVANKPVPTPTPEPEPEPEPEPTPEPEPAPVPTDSPPTVSWATPTAGSYVTRKISGSTCEALASDDKGIVKVVMKVDGAVLNTESDAPWNCIFDSTSVSDGTHTLSATAYDTAGNTRTASISVIVSNAIDPAPEPAPDPTPEPAPSPSPTPGTFPGSGLTIAVDGGHGYWSDAEIGYRTQLGAAVTRHEWDPTEPVDHQDEIVYAAAAQIHTRIHAQLGANWLGTAGSYREFVLAFIARYGLGGTFWKLHPELNEQAYAITTVELGNEPYFGDMSADLYADTVRPTLEAIKSQNLPVKVVLVSRVYGTDTSWMDTLYAKIPNLNNYFYAFADHPYWYGHSPDEGTAAGPFGRISVLRNRMNEKGAADKPIWLTEYGQSTANCGSQCVSEATQKEHLQKLLNAAITRNDWKIGLVSVFQLRDRSMNSTDREHGFGLLRYDGGQKPAYSMVRTLMQQYRG